MINVSLSSKIKAFATISLLCTATFTQALETDTEKELAVGGSLLIGALAGGPAGLFIGALAGVLVSENIDATDKLNTAELNMQKATTEIALLENDIQDMESSLSYMQSEADRIGQNLLTRLEFQMMFRTGDDQLSEFDRERVNVLVQYLNRNPELHVRLDGHADPRGTDEYNNLLAKYRAQTVADELVARGISADRIKAHSHGDSLAASVNGDFEGYALDRRVNIEVFSPKNSKDLATLN